MGEAARALDRETAQHRGRPLLVATAMVCLVLTAAGCSTRPVPPFPTRTPSIEPTRSAAVAQRLQEAVYSRLPAGARNAPALTWHDPATGPTGGAIDNEGKTLLLAASCEGTGTITVTRTGHPDTVLTCARLTSVGPIDLTPRGDPAGSVEFNVRATTGAPQFFATMVALDASAPTTQP